jgi:hypothetical protein
MRKSGIWGVLAALGSMVGFSSLDKFGPAKKAKRKHVSSPSEQAQTAAITAAQEKRARRAERNRANEDRKHD